MASQLTGEAVADQAAVTPPGLRKRNRVEVLLLLVPGLAFQFVWGWFPLVAGIYISLTDGKILRPSQWVGLDNYSRMLHDPVVLQSLQITLLYSGLTILLTFGIPIIVAILIMEMPRKVTYWMLFLWSLPISGITSSMLWRYFYDTRYGLFEYVVVNILHLPASSFLDDPNMVLFWIIFPGLLLYGPGLLYMATVQSIPGSYFEAAEVEGAGFWRKIWTITLPRLRPVIHLTLILAIAGALQPYDNIKILTNGEPYGHSRVIMLYMYSLINDQYRFADAAALGGILFVITVAIVLFVRLVFKEDLDV